MDPGSMSSLMQMITGGIGAVGTGGGIWNNIQNAQYQNKLRSLAQNPAKMMAYAKGFEQPLQAGLLKGVENQTQGYAAERGVGNVAADSAGACEPGDRALSPAAAEPGAGCRL